MNAGTRTIAWLQRELSLEGTRVEPNQAGFRRRTDDAVQTIEVLIPVPGSTAHLLCVRTEVLGRIDIDQDAVNAINTLFCLSASLAGPVYLLPARSLQLCSVFRVDDANQSWVRPAVRAVATLQLSEAHHLAQHLASFRNTASPPQAPASAASVDAAIARAAQFTEPLARSPCVWSRAELSKFLAEHVHHSPALSAARGRHGVMVQFRFGARTTSLLQIVSDRAHARYGNGLHCVQSFPFEAPVALGASVALDLNALELIENPAHHSLGSFGFREGMLQFVSFFPNAMHHPEMLPEVFDACVRRAESVSSRATGSNWAAPRLRPNSLTSLLERMRRH